MVRCNHHVLGSNLSFPISEKTFSRLFIVTKLQLGFDAVLGITWLRDENPDINWTKGTIQFGDTVTVASLRARSPNLEIVNPNAMARIMKKSKGSNNSKTTFFVGYLKASIKDDLREGLNTIEFSQRKIDDYVNEQVQSITTEQAEEYTERIRNVLREFRDVLTPLTGLPPKRLNYDHVVELREGCSTADLPRARVYRMSPEELTELARQVTEYLEQGWIRPGQNPWASPVKAWHQMEIVVID